MKIWQAGAISPTSGLPASKTGRGGRRDDAWVCSSASPAPTVAAPRSPSPRSSRTRSLLLPPYLVKLAVDDGIAAETCTLSVIVVAFLLAGIAAFVLSGAQTYFTGWVGERTLADLRIRLFGHLQRLSLGFFERNRTGAIVSRITNDVEALDQLVTDGLSSLVQNSLVLAGTAVVLFLLDWRLALATLLVLPLMGGATAWFRVRSNRAYRRVRERLGLVTATLAEDISGMRVVQSFTREPASQTSFRGVNEAYKAANYETVAERPLLPGGRRALVRRGGDRARLRRRARRRRKPHRRGAARLHALPLELLRPAAVAALQHVPLRDRRPRPDHLGARRGARGRGCAERARVARNRRARPLRHVRFGSEFPDVLHDFDLEVPPGTTVALVGHTGAGKSTIAKPARFYDPRAGAITIDGHDLREATQSSLRQQLGIVPQEGFLFAGTVAENISFGRPEADRSEIEAAARAVGVDVFVAELPDGLRDRARRARFRLSLGQRQLVAFARALLADPQILILDEATSSVDIGTEQTIERGLRHLLAGRTAFVIAHRLSTIRRADLIVVLDHGRIVEQDTHDKLLAAGGVHAAVRRLGGRRRLTSV